MLRDDGTECDVGEQGEMCVRGECVTKGYELRDHMKKDPNVEAFHKNGPGGVAWLRTGDKGWKDEEGYFSLSGRFKEIINRGGEKISPFEIEDMLQQHPCVQELVAFSVPHADLGEVVGVAVVMQKGRSLTLEDLRAYAT